MSTTLQSDIIIPATYLHKYSPTNTDISSSNFGIVSLTATVTLGNVVPTNGKAIKIYYAFADIDLGTDVTSLNPRVSSNPDDRAAYSDFRSYLYSLRSYIYIPINTVTPNAVLVVTLGDIKVTGNRLYTWIDVDDPLGQPVTLTSLTSEGLAGGQLTNTSATLGSSNTRFVADTGWEFYNPTTGKWHTMGVIGSDPATVWGPGIDPT